jgi:hypothetical protein
MPDLSPDLSDYIEALGEPSLQVLTSARRALEGAIAAEGAHAPAVRAMGRSPSSNRPPTSPPRRSATKTAVLIVLAAAVIAAAVAVALAARSHPSSSVDVTSPRGAPAALADVAATPRGWSPVAFEALQVSVPRAWLVQDPGASSCGGGVRGMIFLGQAPNLRISRGCRYPANVVSVRTATALPVPHARTMTVNGAQVEVGWSRTGSTVTRIERALGMDIRAQGPLSREVLRTVTHSPLSVVDGTGVAAAPPQWRTTTFGGLRFSVPPTWTLTRSAWWGGCPYNIQADVLLLSTATSISDPGCTPPPLTAGYEAAIPGMVIGAGPQLHSARMPDRTCRTQNQLRICVDPTPPRSGLVVGVQLNLLTALVYLPHHQRPDQIEIGLAGSGLTPLRIYDSLHPAVGS